MNTTKNTCIIAVHAGAGYHSRDKEKEKEYRSVCAKACHVAMTSLKSGSSAVDVVALAVRHLEDASCTNAGVGSSLSLDGNVECDASVMDGQSLTFGAVGAISDIKNPILVAKKLVEEQKLGTMSLGRVPPCTMVGSGATKWATEHGMTRVSPELLKTESSTKTYRNHRKRLLAAEERRKSKRRKHSQIHDRWQDAENKDFTCNGIQDTVGAVCIDIAGNMAAGVSSGGISLKQSGRLGPAALYGAGCWAMNQRSNGKPGVAVATSGTGEHLMKTLLAKECSQCLQEGDFTEDAFRTVFQDKFLDSDFLQGTKEKFGGVLALKFDRSDTGEAHAELHWGHTTDSMCIGYMSEDSKVKTVISRLEDDKEPGTTFVMEGKSFIL